ncbi:MerR family transcriptional regulator [Streptomyces sp. VRA16 Mangrove soil]|uniref:MerR family transcriptional regulator n=1 Tax=Streptomyces sp. VRA16 Mangrove soil TaxID=2817434 RepID=UPI001A9FA9A1|nr:MerR family transcriptional regulator [Streptomyces sp. VRA16 Mangrove soil]MBO1330334.1 MerR family transcriptional regulator [Streptomyces sp. VRA16 Mangrove soil]
MRIGELSRRTGVRTHQLRYYESQGLLRPRRGPNGYRDYGDDAPLTVGRIRHLLEAGLSTRDIASILPCATGSTPQLGPCEELLTTLRDRRADLDAHIDTLVRTRGLLQSYIEATERLSTPAV